MATEDTQNYSPSMNSKKYWRKASSPRTYCPKGPVNVSSTSGRDLSPNGNPEFKGPGNYPCITGYQLNASKDEHLDAHRRPAEACPPALKSSGGQDSALIPSGGPESALIPSGGPESALIPSGGPESALIPSGGPESALIPSGGQDSALIPSGEPESALIPSGGPESALIPSGGQDSTLIPSGGPESALIPSGGPESALIQSGGPESALIQSGGPESTLIPSGGPESKQHVKSREYTSPDKYYITAPLKIPATSHLSPNELKTNIFKVQDKNNCILFHGTPAPISPSVSTQRRPNFTNSKSEEINCQDESRNITCHKRLAQISGSSKKLRQKAPKIHQRIHETEFRDIPATTCQTVLKQRSPKSAQHLTPEIHVVNSQRDYCNVTSRKRPAASSPSSAVFPSGESESPQQVKQKIIRLEEKYCAERKRHLQSNSNKLGSPSFDEPTQKQSRRESVNLVESRNFTKPTNAFNTKTNKLILENEWKTSTRPSLENIPLPIITPENRLKVYYDDRGKYEILGKGAFGFVARGEVYIENEKHNCVVKIFRPQKSTRQMILNEGRILSYLGSTGAVPELFGVSERKDPKKLPRLVQECFADGQDFCDLLDNDDTSKKDWIRICLNAAVGLSKIHSKGVLINDISEDNILVDDNNNIRFIDMGLATLGKGMTFIPGPEVDRCTQIAPECKKGEETTYRSDIFSFGDILRCIGEEENIRELNKLGDLLKCRDPSQRSTICETIKRLKELDARL